VNKGQREVQDRLRVPSPFPAGVKVHNNVFVSDDEDGDSDVQDSFCSRRKDRMEKSQDLLATKRAELKYLMQEKERHDNILRSELSVSAIVLILPVGGVNVYRRLTASCSGSQRLHLSF
jgi:hypothetical protein